MAINVNNENGALAAYQYAVKHKKRLPKEKPLLIMWKKKALRVKAYQKWGMLALLQQKI